MRKARKARLLAFRFRSAAYRLLAGRGGPAPGPAAPTRVHGPAAAGEAAA
ncbi:hypothetical protein [Streptomyces niger]|nr:hypothetical protein [Streptomyces niger]